MNSKKLFLIVLSVLIVAFVSCNKVTAIPTFKVSDIAGGWTGTGYDIALVIDNNRNLTYIDNNEKSTNTNNPIKYKIPEADWNSEKTEYTINGEDVGIPGASITFKSATSGTATSAAGTIDISKVQQ